MSCDHRRKAFWRDSLHLSTKAQKEIEKVYTGAGFRLKPETVTPGQQTEWTAKTVRLGAFYRAYDIEPPIHGENHIPRTKEALAGCAAVWDWLDRRGLTCVKHRPGLPPRKDGGWEKGQMTDDEYEFFRELAIGRDKPIIVTGSLAETYLGMGRRYDQRQRHRLTWRESKAKSELVDTGEARDIDIGQISQLTDEERGKIIGKFTNKFPGKRIKIDEEGYNADDYDDIEAFKKAGAIVFYPDGHAERISAPWQLPEEE